MEQQANPPHPPPKIKDEGAQKPKRAIPPPTPPPPPQIKDEAAQKPTRTIFLSLIWGGGRGQV